MKDIEPIPQAIVKAICRVQASIDAVTKSQFNKQGGYKFASTDDIYAAVARKFGEAGLMIYPLELSQPEIKRVEKTNKEGELVVSQWGQFHFGYVLATEDASWFHPASSRTIYIQILGPQTFNAAESYCQKQFLRGLLKLPTGDMDLDTFAQGESEEDQIAGNSAGVKRKSSYSAKKDGSTVPVFNEIKQKIIDATGQRDALIAIRKEYGAWQTMPAQWATILDNEYEDAILACRDAAE